MRFRLLLVLLILATVALAAQGPGQFPIALKNPTPAPPGATATPTSAPGTPTDTPTTPTPTPQGGTVVTTGADPATNGSNLQAAIDAANPGDTLLLTAGAEYRANLSMPSKAGGSYITITTSGFPVAAGARVSPADASSMAKLTTANSSAVITFVADSKYWKFIGVEIMPSAGMASTGHIPNLVSNINNGSITYDHWPNHIVFDRYLIHPYETDAVSPYRGAEYGFSVDGSDISFLNGYAYDFTGWYGPPSVLWAVTAATNENPVKVTFAQDVPWLEGNKRLMFFSGGTGDWTGLNGLKVGTYVDAHNVTLENYDPTTFALSNVNSLNWSAFAGQTVNRMDNQITFSPALLIQTGPGPYVVTNNFMEGYYSQLFTGGASSTWIAPENSVTVTAAPANNQATLSSLGNLQVNDLIAFKVMQKQTISAATNAAQVELTVPAHVIPAGMTLYGGGGIEMLFSVDGFTGPNWSQLNGNYSNAYVVNATTIRLPVDTTNWGACGGCGTTANWVPFAPKRSGGTRDTDNWSVGKVTNINNLTVTYDYLANPKGAAGNGAGTPPAVGSLAQFNGRKIDGLTITHNTFSNRKKWIQLYRDVASTCNSCSEQGPKAFWESKMADNVSLTGNVIQVEGGRLDPNAGFVSLAINQANQIGSTPWVTNSHWLVQSNLFMNYTYMKFSLVEEYDSGMISTDLVVDNNLFTAAKTPWVNFEGSDGITLTHNTIRNETGSVGAYNDFIACLYAPNTNALIRNNVGNWQLYGYNNQGGPSCWQSLTRDHNFLIDDWSQNFSPPAGDTRIADDTAMRFVDIAACDSGADYHGCALAANSPGHGSASDGKDVGVDFTALDAALGP